MSATIKLKTQETVALGEVDTYTLTWRVAEASNIDANIFVVEYTRSNPYLNKFDSEFHHVAYLPEMSSLPTVLDNNTHQYIRQSTITRTYTTYDRMQESKKVMLEDIRTLLRTYNDILAGSKESEITITADGYTSEDVDDTTYTFDGEEIII